MRWTLCCSLPWTTYKLKQSEGDVLAEREPSQKARSLAWSLHKQPHCDARGHGESSRATGDH